MNLHAMIDLETLGLSPAAPILQLGVTLFDTSHIYRTISWIIRPDTLEGADFDTLCWWSDQSDEARYNVLSAKRTNRVSLPDAVEALTTEIDSVQLPEHETLEVWAKPSDFDLACLRYHASRLNIKLPWGHRASRCQRTLMAMMDKGKEDEVKPEIPHDAGYDSLAQAQTVQHLLVELGDRMSHYCE